MSRTYTPDQKASALAALRANGGNLKRTGIQLGIPRKTLSQWRDGTVGVSEVTDQMVETKVDDLADKLDRLAHQIVEIMPDKIQATGLKDLAVTLGIAIDKRRLLMGQPTSISESRTEKARYETAIKQMQDEGKREGMVIPRVEAIRLLEVHLPEINQYVN